MRQLILLWILLACGCKSIKKDKTISISSEKDSTSVSIEEELKIDFKTRIDQVSQDWEVEDRIETHQAFDSAGVTVFKPVVHSRTVSHRSESVQSSRDSMASVTRDSLSGSLKSQDNESLDLHKESEGQEVVTGIVDAFLPSWIKLIIGGLIVLTSVVYGLWLRRKLKKEKDGIPPT